MKLLLTILIGAALAAAADKPFDPKADPDKDVAAAVAVAAKEGKRVLVKAGGEWCGWCHRMDKFIAENETIRGLVERNFVVVKVNYSEENKNEKFFAKYPKIEGYPHLFVLDEAGRLLHSQNTGELEQGKGYDAAKFEAFLRKWMPRR